MKAAFKRARHRRIYRARWRKVRREVFQRDGGVCVRCGGGERLAVHHRVPDGPDYDLSNLETLCAACHAHEHKPWLVIAAKTHCKHGHEFTSENTGRNPGGYRYCRICRRESLRRCYARRKARIAEGVV